MSSINKKEMFDIKKKLSNACTELQLTHQINEQLEKIRVSLLALKDISHTLLYDIADVSNEELERIHDNERQTKSQLLEQENRYKMLKAVQQNGCVLRVEAIAISSAKNLKYYDEITDDELTDADSQRTEQSERNVKSLSNTNGKVDYREDSVDESTDDESSARKSARKTFSPNRFNASITKSSKRKRIVPERFDAEVKSYFNRNKRVNGMQNDD